MIDLLFDVLKYIPTLAWTILILSGIFYGIKEYRGAKEDKQALQNSKNGRRKVAREAYYSSTRNLIVQVLILGILMLSVTLSIYNNTYSELTFTSLVRAIASPIFFTVIEVLLVYDIKQRYDIRIELREEYLKKAIDYNPPTKKEK